MSSANRKTTVYDYVIVGSGLSGLSVATALSKEGAQVLLLEASEAPGGMNRSVQTKLGPTDNGLRFLPNTDLAVRSVEFLSSLIGTEIKTTAIAREPMTYESGGMRPFVGFGAHPPEFYEELAYFLNPSELQFEQPLSHWTERLFENFKGEFAPRSYVTKFHLAEGKIHSLTINGSKSIQALNIIYAAPVKSLKVLLPEEAMGTRSRQKFAKSQFWTSVGLDLIHGKPVTEFQGIHMLNGTTQDDLGPSIGRFSSVQNLEGHNVQMSQWVSYMDDQEAEDSEKIGAALKKLKRQIKRAYPEALDGMISERILVVPSASGNGELKLTGHQTLPTANNFWVANGAVHPLKNTLGSLAQAQLVTSSLGVHPLGADLEESNDNVVSTEGDLDS